MSALSQRVELASLRSQVEKKWPGFTPTDLDEIGNNCRRLTSALQRKFGLSQVAAEQESRRLACMAWKEHQREEWLAG
jgi:hypothetical protein